MAEPSADDDVAAVMRAARVISAIVAESLAQVDETVTMPQLRVLVLVATRPEVNASAVAASLSTHLSNASRLCDRLVQAGLIDRRQSTVDRRNLVLSLTTAGSTLLDSVLDHRRRAFAEILLQMSPPSRATLRRVLEEFSSIPAQTRESEIILP